MPVRYEVARALNAPLDVFLVRKLGLPGHEELAMGAVASGGVCVPNPEVVNALRIPHEVIDAVTEKERKEAERQERAYRGEGPASRWESQAQARRVIPVFIPTSRRVAGSVP